jgi:hypothetical protein
MLRVLSAWTFAALAAAAALAATLPVSASPLPGLSNRPVDAVPLVTPVQGFYFGYGYGRPYYRPYYGPYYGPYYRPYYDAPPPPPPVAYYESRPYVAVPPPGDHDAIARCASRFRSFNAHTGTYITYEGEERLCPYLR